MNESGIPDTPADLAEDLELREARAAFALQALIDDLLGGRAEIFLADAPHGQRVEIRNTGAAGRGPWTPPGDR